MPVTITGDYTNNVDYAEGSDVSTDLNALANAYNAHEADTAEHGATGANVGTTNTQTLTNKTINSGLATTTTIAWNLSVNSLTTGTGLDINSTSTDASARYLLKITQDDATAAAGAIPLRIQQDYTGNMVEFYDGAVLVGTIDDEGQIIVPLLRSGDTLNLGVTDAGGVFTITDASGAALSATNFGYVGVKSTTAGRTVSLRVDEATHLFQDDAHASSHLTNLGFGITETAHWANDMPWFLYVVNEDDTEAGLGFFISRSPCMSVTPAATYIHDYDAAAANDTQNSIFGMWNDDVGKAAKPCTCIGAFRMQWSTTTDDWTVQTLGNNDGIGQDRIDVTCATSYTMSIGQNGATAGKYMLDNGGTAPTFETNFPFYNINRNGTVLIDYFFNANTATDGNGAVVALIHLPYNSTSTTQFMLGPVHVETTGLGAIGIAGSAEFDVGVPRVHLFDLSLNLVQNLNFQDGNRTIVLSGTYKAF